MCVLLFFGLRYKKVFSLSAVLSVGLKETHKKKSRAAAESFFFFRLETDGCGNNRNVFFLLLLQQLLKCVSSCLVDKRKKSVEPNAQVFFTGKSGSSIYLDTFYLFPIPIKKILLCEYKTFFSLFARKMKEREKE